jgi:hypothetical protein
MKKSALIILLIGLLSGCAATGDGYREYPKNQAHATLRGSDTFYVTTRVLMQIESIDGQPITTSLWTSADKFSIAPGAHTVKAYTFIKDGVFAEGRQIHVTLRFNAVAGQDYSLQSKVSGDKMNVWIVDSRGGISSPVVSADHLPFGANKVEVNDLPH